MTSFHAINPSTGEATAEPLTALALAETALPIAALPEALRDANPLGIWRLVDGTPTRDALERPFIAGGRGTPGSAS